MTTRVASVPAVAPGRQAKSVSARERILVAGVDTPAGRAVAGAFAARQARLVVQATSDADDVVGHVGRLSAVARSISLHAGPFADRSDVIETVQTAIHALGGIDAAIVSIALTPEDLGEAAHGDGIETLLSDKLAPVLELVQVAANRMGLTWTRGLILAVLSLPPVQDARQALVLQIVKATLAGLVRREARRLGEQDIGVVAIVASAGDDMSDCTPDVGLLATMLTGEEHGALSGVVYEASLDVTGG